MISMDISLPRLVDHQSLRATRRELLEPGRQSPRPQAFRVALGCRPQQCPSRLESCAPGPQLLDGHGTATIDAGPGCRSRDRGCRRQTGGRAGQTYGAAETKNPAKMLPFVQQGRKLIFYHGTSDPAIPSARRFCSITNLLATARDGQGTGRRSIVSGARHATLQRGHRPGSVRYVSAIEAWAEHRKAAGSHPGRTKRRQFAPHSLPLCPSEAGAKVYSGSGAVTDAANWACAAPAK